MPQKFVIVSPDTSLAALLKQALVQSGMGREPVIFTEYPTVAQLRRLADTSGDSLVAVIIGLTEQARAVRLIADFSVTHPHVLMVAADTVASAERILASMRAGASEFLSPPFELEHLVRRFEHQRALGREARAAGKLICFMPVQGGNGASTVAIHVADAIRRQLLESQARNGKEGKGVLLVDFDFHSGTIAFRLRLKPEFTLADAAERADVIDELWDRLASNWKGIDVLPAPPPGTSIPAERAERLASIFTSATRTYPFVLVDLPTALYSSSRDLLISADMVYLVCTPEVMSLHLARRRVAELNELGLRNDSIRLVLNRVGSKRTIRSEDVADLVGIPVEWSLDNDYGAITDAYLKGTLIRGDSGLGRQLSALALHVMGIDAPAKPASRRWRTFLSFE